MNAESVVRLAALLGAVAAVGAGGAAVVAGQGASKPSPPGSAAPAPKAAAPTITMPPLPNPGFQPPRPMPMMQEVYKFAAIHPEMLKYVPCYCGCGADGHPHNESCFVKRRDPRGNVTEWETHGFG